MAREWESYQEIKTSPILNPKCVTTAPVGDHGKTPERQLPRKEES